MESATVLNGARMRKRVLSIISITILIACCNGISEARSPFLHLQDNSYRNVLVAISSAIEEDADLIEEIQTLLTEASQQLFIATKQHVYFKEITILVPALWNQTLLPQVRQAKHESFEEADIKIGSSLRQKIPYTKKHGGCGQRGLSINLSPDFILSSRNDSNLISNAKKFVREWAYYQYGVFEECGYANDDLFPPFYYHHNTLTVTGCSEKPHDYTFQGNCTVGSLTGIPDTNCEFTRNINTSSTTSILNNPSLGQITHFCDAKTHNFDAPTKQNFLCREKSAWEVIKSNEDFANLNPTSDSNTNTTPSFTFVFVSNMTYIVLLDESGPMKDNNKFEAAQAVLGRFFKNHVQDGSAVALTGFAEESKIICNETMITDETSRTKVTVKMPDHVQITAHQADITAGILTSVYIFKPRTSTVQVRRRVLILVTAGEWKPIDVATVCTTLQEVAIRLMIIVLRDNDKPLTKETTTALLDLASCTRGKIFNIPAISPDNYPLTVERLDAAIRATLSPKHLEDRSVQVFRKHFDKSPDATISGNFTLDKSISDSVFTVTYDKNKNVDKIILTQPDGTMYNGDFDKAILGFSRKYYLKDAQLGVWKYQIILYEQFKNSSVALTVALTAKSKPNQEISVKCWTNVQVVDDQTPVILYAEVQRMNAPVVNAKIIATIHAPDPDQSYELPLHDSGNGDPDISENDGIYSRYLIRLPNPGFYSIEINVEGTDGDSTSVFNSISADQTSDCQQPIYTSSPTGTFNRFAVGPSFYVSKARDNATYPPNRISYLRVNKVNSSTKQIQLEWSPAGEDLDSEEVPLSNYQIRYSVDRKALTEQHFDNANAINSTVGYNLSKKPKLTSVFTVPNDNTLYYFAIRTTDSQGYRSEVSNIVSAFVQALELPETTANSSFPLEETEKSNKGASAARAGPIIGIVVAVVLVLVILVVVWRITRNRRRRKEQIKTNSVSYERVPTKNESIKPISEESDALTGSVDETAGDSEVNKSAKHENTNEQKSDADLSGEVKINAKGDDQV